MIASHDIRTIIPFIHVLYVEDLDVALNCYVDNIVIAVLVNEAKRYHYSTSHQLLKTLHTEKI